MMTTFHILAGVRTKANTSDKIFPGMSNFWNCHSRYSTQDWGQRISGALCPLCPAQFPPTHSTDSGMGLRLCPAVLGCHPVPRGSALQGHSCAAPAGVVVSTSLCWQPLWAWWGGGWLWGLWCKGSVFSKGKKRRDSTGHSRKLQNQMRIFICSML